MPTSCVYGRALLIAIVGVLFCTGSTVADESTERVVRFPTGRTVGMVYLREAKEGRAKSCYSTLYSDEWRAIGPARGEAALAVLPQLEDVTLTGHGG
jgi:hypothetical protein